MRLTFFAFLAMLPTATSAASKNCGVQHENYQPNILQNEQGTGQRKLTRIIGGDDKTQPHSWPWQVLVQTQTFKDRSYTTEICGGSLIRVNDDDEASDIVVTAAHCVVTDETWDTDNPVLVDIQDPTKIKITVYLGTHQRDEDSDGEQDRKVVDISKFDKYNRRYHNDIALLKLESPVNFTDTIRPVCLPTQDEGIPVDEPCATAGWGRYDKNKQELTSNVLKQLKVTVHDPAKCKQGNSDDVQNGWGDMYVEAEHICAGEMLGLEGVCNGDSGGMMACKPDGHYTLYGVTTFVASENGGTECVSEGRPPLFSRVSTYVKWIDDEVLRLSSLNKGKGQTGDNKENNDKIGQTGTYVLDLASLFAELRPKGRAEPPKVPYVEPPTKSS